MTLYQALELAFYGSVVAALVGVGRGARYAAALLFVLLVVLSVVGRHG